MTANMAFKEAADNNVLAVLARGASIIATLIMPVGLLYINSISGQLTSIQNTLNASEIKLATLQTKVDALDSSYQGLSINVYRQADALRDFKLRDQSIDMLNSQLGEIKGRMVIIEGKMIK